MAPNRRREQREEAERARRQTEAMPTVYASLLHRGRLKRRWQITGDVDAVVEYDAGPVRFGRPVAVRLDGVEVASMSPTHRDRYDPEGDVLWTPPLGEYQLSLLGEHHLSFVVPLAADSAAVHVDVKVTSFMIAKIAALSLKIGAVPVYVERGGRVWINSPPNAPIVATAPEPESSALPLPAPPQSEQTQPPNSLCTPWWKFWGR